MSKKVRNLCQGALIAALYAVLTLISSVFGLSSGAVQLRLGEALTVLPFFTAAAVPGLTVGCALANILSGGVIWDVIGGSFATLLGALGTRLIARSKLSATVYPILANTLIVPLILRYAYGLEGGYLYFVLTVGAGEILSCGVLGVLLGGAVEKTKLFK